MLASDKKERAHVATQKKIGKRSQAAVCETRQLILTAALAVFPSMVSHGARLEQVAERASVSKTNLLLLYPSKRRWQCRGNATDLDLAGAAQAFSRKFFPSGPSRSISVSSWRFRVIIRRRRGSSWRCWRARAVMEELTGDLKALIDENRADCRMGAQRETGARLPRTI